MTLHKPYNLQSLPSNLWSSGGGGNSYYPGIYYQSYKKLKQITNGGLLGNQPTKEEDLIDELNKVLRQKKEEDQKSMMTDKIQEVLRRNEKVYKKAYINSRCSVTRNHKHVPVNGVTGVFCKECGLRLDEL